MMHIGKLFPLSFAAGNIGRVDFITENEYDLFVRPDTCNPRVRKVILQTRGQWPYRLPSDWAMNLT